MRRILLAIEEWTQDDSTILEFLKMALIITVVLAALIIPAAYLCSFEDAKEPHIVLNKTQWSCTHTHTIMVPMMVGKTIMVMPETQCDQWSMN